MRHTLLPGLLIVGIGLVTSVGGAGWERDSVQGFEALEVRGAPRERIDTPSLACLPTSLAGRRAEAGAFSSATLAAESNPRGVDYESWSIDTLETQHEALLQRYVEQLDSAAADRFAAGEYFAFRRGDLWPREQRRGRIHAVRSLADGFYQQVVLDPDEDASVYELQEEIQRLRLQLFRRSSGRG